MEAYERQFASLRQCCSGTASDLSSFEAKTLSILKRLEDGGGRDGGSGSLGWGGDTKSEGGAELAADQRAREQARFDTNRIVAILKEHEQILMDGFDNKLAAAAACPETPPVDNTTTAAIPATPFETGLPSFCALKLILKQIVLQQTPF